MTSLGRGPASIVLANVVSATLAPHGQPAPDRGHGHPPCDRGVRDGSTVIATRHRAVLPVTAVTLMTLSLGGCADLSKARIDANEASTIGSLRAILSAEYVYSSFNGGAYGSLECLAAPKGCNQADPGQPHLDRALAAAGERSGYRLEFHAGPSSPAAAGRPPGSSLETFAVVATPVTPGSTGSRRFCVDNRGDVCTLDAAATIAGGQCPAACVVLR